MKGPCQHGPSVTHAKAMDTCLVNAHQEKVEEKGKDLTMQAKEEREDMEKVTMITAKVEVKAEEEKDTRKEKEKG